MKDLCSEIKVVVIFHMNHISNLIESPSEGVPHLAEERPRDEDVHEERRDERDEHDLLPPIPQAHEHHLNGRLFS